MTWGAGIRKTAVSLRCDPVNPSNSVVTDRLRIANADLMDDAPKFWRRAIALEGATVATNVSDWVWPLSLVSAGTCKRIEHRHHAATRRNAPMSNRTNTTAAANVGQKPSGVRTARLIAARLPPNTTAMPRRRR